ncbi:MAG: hypothetical protein HKL96_05430 [Phycisphaerales bacterium]|nr:hypothetical protein [Phycisphaerales bacterium]
MKNCSVINLLQKCFCILLIGWGAACTANAATARSAKACVWHGLTIGRGGVLEKDGRPYCGIGVNFVGALRRLLVNRDDPSVRRDFNELEASHIPFVRFPALAAWGTPARCRAYLQRVYQSNPRRYFQAMDTLCAIANKCHVGLIPSLFFTPFWPNDLAHESGLAVWNDSQSRTYRIWTQYVTRMIKRYEHNPAIWGWEFGNELNLRMDLPGVKPRFSGSKRPPDYTHAEMWKLYARFVHLVRQYDPYHIVEAGNSRPRDSSWHNMMDHTWKKDTPSQWAYMLQRDNAAFDMICVHEYRAEAPASILRVGAMAVRWHKPVFVGEFGVPGPAVTSRQLFSALLSSILKARVPLAAVWAFDERHQTVGDHDYSITPSNNRSFMLKAIERANMQLRHDSHSSRWSPGAVLVPGSPN